MSQKGIIRDAESCDASALARIYNYYVKNTTITFEEQEVPESVFIERMNTGRDCGLPWLVIGTDKNISGYAYASRWRDRAAYRNSVETTIYLDPMETGKGYGYRLYSNLIGRLETLGIHSIIGVIALPNDASVGVSEKLGFIKVAHLKEVGYKLGRWIDVGYWQLLVKD